jgi:hypothetical protein
MKRGRNDPCHCGSGKKYKRCCLGLDERVVEDDPLQAAEMRAHHLLATELPAGRLTALGTLPTGSQMRAWSPAENAEPAPSLGALLDVLAREHRPGYLYRG